MMMDGEDVGVGCGDVNFVGSLSENRRGCLRSTLNLP